MAPPALPMSTSFRIQSYFWLGIDLGATNAKAAIVNDDGVVLASHDEPLSKDLSPVSVVDQVALCSEKCLEELGLTFHSISGVGIGCPGKIDADRGIVDGIANFP